MRTADGAWNPLVPYLATVMACPRCGTSQFLPGVEHVVCGACEATYADPEAVLDLAPGHAPRRRSPWTPPVDDGVRWEDQILPRVWARRGSIDRDTLVAWATSWFRPAGRGPVLDLQSGHGWMSRQLARWVGVARVLGLDEDLAVLRAAQASTRDPGMGWLRVDPRSLPFADASVGGVVCYGDPDLLGTDLPAVRELARVLPTDGRLVGLVRVCADGTETVMAGLHRVLQRPSIPTEHTVRHHLDAEDLEVLSWTRFDGLALVACRRRPRRALDA